MKVPKLIVCLLHVSLAGFILAGCSDGGSSSRPPAPMADGNDTGDSGDGDTPADPVDPADPNADETEFNKFVGEMVVAGTAEGESDQPREVNTQNWVFDDSETAFDEYLLVE